MRSREGSNNLDGRPLPIRVRDPSNLRRPKSNVHGSTRRLHVNPRAIYNRDSGKAHHGMAEVNTRHIDIERRLLKQENALQRQNSIHQQNALRRHKDATRGTLQELMHQTIINGQILRDADQQLLSIQQQQGISQEEANRMSNEVQRRTAELNNEQQRQIAIKTNEFNELRQRERLMERMMRPGPRR